MLGNTIQCQFEILASGDMLAHIWKVNITLPRQGGTPALEVGACVVLFVYVCVLNVMLLCCAKTALADDSPPRNTSESDVVDGWFVPLG